MRTRFSTSEDIELCRSIHRKFGTTYYYATLRFPESIKWRIHGLYAFVRVPDEWVDNPAGLPLAEQRARLESWREEMVAGVAGHRPDHPAMRVFCDAVEDCRMPIEEAHRFLDAMLMDLDRKQYETFEDLREYVRGSASAVGVLMCHAMSVQIDGETLEYAKALGEAMQLTNFLRDVAEDCQRGRVYLPQEDLLRFGVSVSDLEQGRNSDRFRELMAFEIERARAIYAYSDLGIQRLPDSVRKAVLLARLLYSQILDRIEERGYDVFSHRARTNLLQKAVCATEVALASDRILCRLVGRSSLA